MPSHTLIVEPGHAGQRIDRFVADRLPALSRSRVQALLKAGCVTRNDLPARPSETLRAGDRIIASEPAPVETPGLRGEDIPLDVLHEDADLIALNKPAGIVVHPGAGNPTGTLVNALLHHCGSLSVIGGTERPGIVHRLDKETSGCLVIAKNDQAHRSLARQFAGRTVEKTYLAIVTGTPRHLSGRIDAAIGRHPVHRKMMAVTDRAGAREAITDWRVLATGDGLTLIECRPKTGRTHQIRVHFKHLGHPVAGDSVYGKRGPFARHLLHAWKLSFDHPATGARLALSAPIPPDFPLVPPAPARHS